VVVYQVIENPSLPEEQECVYPIPYDRLGPINDPNTATLLPGSTCKRPAEEVQFKLQERAGRLYLEIADYTPIRKRVVSFFRSTIPALLFPPTLAPVLTSTDFDIDLHIVSNNGQHIGMNYSTGVYENEIEGATTSGDMPGGGPEWIELPSDVLFRAYLDASPALDWAGELGILGDIGGLSGRIRFIDFDDEGHRTETDPIELDAISRETASPPTTVPSSSSPVTHGPNPVTGTGTSFFYTLPDGTSTARLMIFNVAGRPVFETPLDADSTRFPSAGTWNPVNQDGIPLANGPYVYVLIANGKVIGQGKMVIQR
ncbi:hypothetical protein KAU37_03895, partial [Candidatus Bipolaricaulota bacterium]|nr:hypothetical protein [Candidatus Bipolaricaulota bacterium]